MADERNFRSSYYEKVGCRGVEEKKSLEILMKEKPWDKVKLKQFCLRFTVPAAYRNLVWKVLLGEFDQYFDEISFVVWCNWSSKIHFTATTYIPFYVYGMFIVA